MANNPWLYPDSPLSADARAKLAAQRDADDVAARKAATDRAEAFAQQERERNARTRANDASTLEMQQRQRAAIRGEKASK